MAKHVPKFLQAHSHLLHKGPKPDEPRVVKEQDDSDIEDYDGVRTDGNLFALLRTCQRVESLLVIEKRPTRLHACVYAVVAEMSQESCPAYAGCTGTSDFG